MINYSKTLHNIFKHIYFGYLLESTQRGDSNKYPKHMFYEDIRIKPDLSCISFCSLRILYNSKFIIMTTFLGTNTVIVTRVHFILNILLAKSIDPDQNVWMCRPWWLGCAI